LRPPGIAQLCSKLLGQEFGDLVLEPFASLVGEGKVVGIGADPQFARAGGTGSQESSDQNEGSKGA
jgi:hypothetical protein